MWSDVMGMMILACAVCFGTADGPLLDAARLGVLVMVGVTCTVLAVLGRFFLRLAKKRDSPHFARSGKGDSPLFSAAGKGDSPLFR